MGTMGFGTLQTVYKKLYNTLKERKKRMYKILYNNV